MVKKLFIVILLIYIRQSMNQLCQPSLAFTYRTQGVLFITMLKYREFPLTSFHL